MSAAPVVMRLNLVEDLADESTFDQLCKHGGRADTHAVYCHNLDWPEAPRKCYRTWYTGGKLLDEDCAGFASREVQS